MRRAKAEDDKEDEGVSVVDLLNISSLKITKFKNVDFFPAFIGNIDNVDWDYLLDWGGCTLCQAENKNDKLVILNRFITLPADIC